MIFYKGWDKQQIYLVYLSYVALIDNHELFLHHGSRQEHHNHLWPTLVASYSNMISHIHKDMILISHPTRTHKLVLHLNNTREKTPILVSPYLQQMILEPMLHVAM